MSQPIAAIVIPSPEGVQVAGAGTCSARYLNAPSWRPSWWRTWMRGNRNETLRYSWAVGLEAGGGDIGEDSR